MLKSKGFPTLNGFLALTLFTASLGFTALAPTTAAAAPTVVNLNGTTVGRTFEGVGGVFSNGMTKLLMDYPANQQNDILDLLFKPKFGASLQHLKVEIGTDVNSSSGTEPSHMRSATDFDITRGAGLWIADKAKDISPAIKLDALRWGTPLWITDPTHTVAEHDNSYLFYKKFLEGARDTYGLNFDYLGTDKNEHTLQSEWNSSYNPAASLTSGRARDFVVNKLKPGLNADGFSDVGLVIADSNTGWWIADKVAADTGLKNSIEAMAVHYLEESTANARNSGKALWAGEDLAPLRYDFDKGSLDMAYRIMKMYTVGKMTKYEMHPPIESSYPTTPFNTKSILVAQTPWSGHYEVLKGLWVTAHFTQFADIGWKYIDSGNQLDDYGGYTLMKHPTTSDWSLIVLNKSSAPKQYTFNLSGGLSTGTVKTWKTNDTVQFVQESNITPSSGSFTVTVDPYSIYTFTTTTGQQKGAATSSNPASESFSLAAEYSDNFDSYSVGKMPKYTSDQGGAFEIIGDGSGKALVQVINTDNKPLDWKYRTTPDPYTLLGSVDWRNYEVEVDIKYTDADTSGYTLIGGRVAHNGKSSIIGDPAPAGGYNLKIANNGAWQLRAAERVITSGTLSGYVPNVFNNFRLRFTGTNIKAYYGGSATPFVNVNDNEFASGQAQLGTGYNKARFDNLKIRRLDAATPVDVVRYDEKDSKVIFNGAWEALDGNYEQYRRTMVGSRTAGDTMEIKFNGSTAIVTGTLDRDGGKADVYVDGVLQGEIDTYSAARKHRRAIYTTSGLSAGEHTLKLVVKGTKSAASIDHFVRVDTIEVYGGNNNLLSFNSDYMYDTFVGMTSGVPSPDWAVAADPGTSANVGTDPSTKKWIILSDTYSGTVPAANKAVLDRKFAPVSGEVTWEFEYMAPTLGTWNRFALSNNGVDGIQMYDTNLTEAFAYVKPDGTRAKIANLTPGVTHLIRIEANTNTGTFSAYVDNALKVSSAMFKSGVTQFDRIHVETSGSNTASTLAYIDNIRLNGIARSNVTTIQDLFDVFPNGTEAKQYRQTTPDNLQMLDWELEVTPSSSPDKCVVDPSPSSTDKSFKCTDTSSTGNLEAVRDFARVDSGLVTVEYKFKQDAVNRWTRFLLGNDSENIIEIYDTASDGLAFKTATGTAPYISLGTINANTWYTLRLVVDLEDQTFDAYLNGLAKLKDQPFTDTTFNGINNLKFRSGDSTTVNLFVDQVRVGVE
jgi:galactosylceramidase